MKYFTKYIPVEGERIIKKSNSILSRLYTLDPIIQSMEKSSFKLFLCSRDIQVGDKVRSFNYPDNEAEVENLRVSKKSVGLEDHSEIYHLVDLKYKEGDIQTSAISQFFKVIGEVSPEAIWIKEGMEFDGIEVSLTQNQYIPIGWHGDNNPKTVYIKCPQCNTFH